MLIDELTDLSHANDQSPDVVASNCTRLALAIDEMLENWEGELADLCRAVTDPEDWQHAALFHGEDTVRHVVGLALTRAHAGSLLRKARQAKAQYEAIMKQAIEKRQVEK